MSELTKISQSLIIKKIDAKTLNIQVLNNEILTSIAGQFDQNLKELEKLEYKCLFSWKFNNLQRKINNLKIFADAIKFLVNKYELTNFIEHSDIVISVKKNMKLEESNIESFKQLIKTPRKSVIAKSQKQSEYIKALKNNDIVISGACWNGKSQAVSVAVTLLMKNSIGVLV